MEDTQQRRRPWLFENGHGEWVRWTVAMAIGAAVVWASINTRLATVETQVGAINHTLEQMQADLRQVIFSRRAQ
jgi:hypothetical protein